MVLDSEKLEKNALTLIRRYPSSKKFLRKANGKKDYQGIAKELGVNPKTVSPSLSLAKDLGFAEKIRPGIYKKITSNMKYIPNEKKIEKRSSIEGIIKKFSGKIKSKVEESNLGYSLDFKNKIAKMANAYKWLFITENALRELIRKVFVSEKNWWDNKIPGGIKEKIEEMKKNVPYDEAKRKDELDYTHLGQLKEIITYKLNWDLFSPYLKKKDKKTFQVEIERVLSSRNAIGHCISLVGDDYKYAEMRFKAILKLLKE